MTNETEMVHENPSARIEYIDVFRGFGILLMMMGHIGYGVTFDFFIHAFHMPMFFWISGYFFKHKREEDLTFLTFLLKKARSLLLPYFIFGIAHYLLYIAENYFTHSHNQIDFLPLLHLFSDNTTGLPNCGAIWFLTALFFTDVLYFLIDRYILSEILKIIVVMAIALFGNFANSILPFTLPFSLGASLVGIGLYYLGYLCKKYREKGMRCLFNLSWIPNILLGAVTLFLISLNGYINMRTGTYAIIPLFWMNAMLSIIVGMNFARLIYRYIQKNYIGSWLTGIGRDSIVYVCLNQVVILIVNRGLSGIGLSPLPSKILTFIITLFVLWVAEKMIVNSKLKILIGK